MHKVYTNDYLARAVFCDNFQVSLLPGQRQHLSSVLRPSGSTMRGFLALLVCLSRILQYWGFFGAPVDSRQCCSVQSALSKAAFAGGTYFVTPLL